MILNDRVLEVGSTFNQFDINEGRLSYRHDGTTDVLLDGFLFNIHFPDDLWWPNRSLKIQLDTPEPTWEVLITSDSVCLEDSSITLDVLVAELEYGPYRYSLDSINYQSSPIFNGLSPGSFTVYLRYGNDQIANQQLEVLSLTGTYHLDDKDLEIFAEGGIAPYTYRWMMERSKVAHSLQIFKVGFIKSPSPMQQVVVICYHLKSLLQFPKEPSIFRCLHFIPE